MRMGGWEPSSTKPSHPRPGQPVSLTAPAQSAQPKPGDFVIEAVDPVAVAGHGVVGVLATKDTAQPPALLRDRGVAASRLAAVPAWLAFRKRLTAWLAGARWRYGGRWRERAHRSALILKLFPLTTGARLP
jgi:hypothetical protein